MSNMSLPQFTGLMSRGSGQASDPPPADSTAIPLDHATDNQQEVSLFDQLDARH